MADEKVQSQIEFIFSGDSTRLEANIAQLKARLAALEQSGEKAAKGYANLKSAVNEAEQALENSKGLRSTKQRAEVLGPAVTRIKEAFDALGSGTAKALGITDESFTNATKSAKGFKSFLSEVGAASSKVEVGLQRQNLTLAATKSLYDSLQVIGRRPGALGRFTPEYLKEIASVEKKPKSAFKELTAAAAVAQAPVTDTSAQAMATRAAAIRQLAERETGYIEAKASKAAEEARNTASAAEKTLQRAASATKASVRKVAGSVSSNIRSTSSSLEVVASAAAEFQQTTRRAAAGAAEQTRNQARRVSGQFLLGAGAINEGPSGSRAGAGAGAGAGGGTGPSASRARRPQGDQGFNRATGGATESLNREAKAAEATAAAMRDLAKAKQQVVGGEEAVSKATGGLIAKLMEEMKAAPRAAAALHQMMRQMEASVNPAYAARSQALGQAVQSVGKSATGAAGGLRSMFSAQEGILGTVKSVLGMAAGYSAVQGVVSEIGVALGHLKGGIIEFNSMIETATVGFTTLFQNQADQVNEAASKYGDFSQRVEYIAMGYKSAQAAATGTIETIRQFANITPFRFEELQDATLRMRAFGFSLSEVLKQEPGTNKFSGAVVDVGNAVAALGGGADAFRRITYALGQMKQAGRVYQNDMMQLANAGIGGYRYIADALKDEISKNADGTLKKMNAADQKLYDQLSKNAIETVRRLTTNGQISGEAAARAILAGLNKDFGGGMDALSKTFSGALSTVADMSQSIVAEAFTPLYNAISEATYNFGQQLQGPNMQIAAKAFRKVVYSITTTLTEVGAKVAEIAGKIFADISGAFTKSGTTIGTAGDLLKLFGEGVGVVGDLLSNKMTRGIILATGAIKLLTVAVQKNPLLTLVAAVTVALGALKEAYDQNFLGFADTINTANEALTPLIESIKRDLAPAVAEIVTALGEGVIGSLIAIFKTILPILTAAAAALAAMLKAIKPLAPIIAGVILALGARFGYSKIVAGMASIKKVVADLALEFQIMGENAAMAAKKMTDAAAAKSNKSLVLYGPTRADMGAPEALPAGSPSMTSRIGGFFGGLGNRAGSIGMAGIFASMIGDMVGIPSEITSAVSNISSALIGFSFLKQIVPAGSFSAITSGLSSMLGAIVRYAGVAWASIVSGLSRVLTAVLDLPIVSTKINALLVAIASLGPAALTAAGAIGTLALALGAAVGGFLVANAAINAAYLNEFKKYRPQSTEAEAQSVLPALQYAKQEFVARLPPDEQIRRVGQLFGAETARLFGEYLQAKTNEIQNRWFKGLNDGMAAWARQAATFTKGQIDTSLYNFRMGEKLGTSASSYGSVGKAVVDVTKKLGLLVPKLNSATSASNALTEAQKKEADAAREAAQKLQEALQAKLQYAQSNLQAVQSTFETLAKSALQDLLNPSERVNPYTGLMEAGLTLEEVLNTTQEMMAGQYTDSSGMVRNFMEYKDVLESIKPLTEKDYAIAADGTKLDQISLKAVKERLKIDKDRRQELERIKAIAQAEFDLSVATLKQYDESIDPLERALQLRQAQEKYTTDIQDVQMQGLQNLATGIENSPEWEAASRATKKKLADVAAGQQAILNEMQARFEKYNRDIAYIMANPDFSEAEKSAKLQEALDNLRSDLSSQFGLTEDVINTEFEKINASMDLARATTDSTYAGLLNAITNPKVPAITFGQALIGQLKSNVYDPLISMMKNYLVQVTSLAQQIKDAAAAAAAAANALANTPTAPGVPGTSLGDQIMANKQSYLDYYYQGLMAHIVADKLTPSIAAGYMTHFAAMQAATTFTAFKALWNKYAAYAGVAKLAKGGPMNANSPYLVGEQGPELVVPRQSGLVLNNNISSRLMSMLSGNGSGGNFAYVTVNINNPTIRSDADIRKLADQISRAQASQFRSQGGRFS